MKNNNTKKNLTMSAISMLLCVVMLVGLTFAWFTDSVTNGKNKIQAGNLDVELEYSTDMSAWTKVTENASIFDENALWEPGYTQTVYFKITNKGNLAFKYQFGTSVLNNYIGKNHEGEPIDLTKLLKFGIDKNITTKYADRNAAYNAIKNTAIDFGTFSAAGELLSFGESDVVAMTVFMPENIGNEANHGTNPGDTPYIDFGINVVATQKQHESDSFGNNYDANAQYPAVEYGDIIAPTPAAEFEEKLNSAQNGDTIVVNGTVALTKSLTVSKDITIKAGTAGATFTGTPLHIGKDVNVVLEGLNFNRPTNVNDTASSVYASDFSGDLTVKNCIFTDCAWEGIQITPAENCGKIEIIGCEFKNPNLKSIRFLHIEADPNVGTNANIVIADNDFGALEQLNLNDRRASMIDVDYIDSFDRLTAYGNNIKQGTDDIYVYVCLDNAGQYKMLNNSVTFFTKAK
ncbi:MAG: TasA family protein [Anaerovoracaceae bacterium]|nr:TasA family protein [Anaerovoracaceae bacterium]